MSAYLEGRVAVLERLVESLLRRQGAPFALGRASMPAIDTAAVQTVQVQLDALSTRDNVPVLYGYGMTASPPVGTDMHIAFLDGDRSKAVAIASGHQTYRKRGLLPGDSALYDVRGVSIWLTAAGPLVTCQGLPMTITGDLHVTGKVYAGYGGANQVSLQTHQHGVGTPAPGTSAPTAGT